VPALAEQVNQPTVIGMGPGDYSIWADFQSLTSFSKPCCTLQINKRMRRPTALEKFLNLVITINRGLTARSENDLTRHLAAVLDELGLSTVTDTAQLTSAKRPDILGYKNRIDADLVLPADVVIEAKKPVEVDYTDMRVALAEALWDEKTFPYVVENLSRIKFYILTTFVDFVVLAITPELRTFFAAAAHTPGGDRQKELQKLVADQARVISLGRIDQADDPKARSFSIWLTEHLRPELFDPIPLSQVRSTIPVSDTQGLETFATRLAEIAAGQMDGSYEASAGIFGSVRERLPKKYSELDPDTRRDLHLFVMSQMPAADPGVVGGIINADPERWLDDFIAASIHSLLSRLFALKVIEDNYCVGREKPLIERSLWVINAPEYDSLNNEELIRSVGRKIRALKDSSNFVVHSLSVFGAFFDWITRFIDPMLFRVLIELFVTNDLGTVEGDLLGRFFELYAQRINSTKRRALGQYYTPLPVVRFMWYLAAEHIKKRGISQEITVLDPGMGSATFLSEGVGWLKALSVVEPWRHIVGFDISPQVMGIAQVNLYMSLLLHSTESEAKTITDLRLYTTDALDPKNGKYLLQLAPLFTDANHRSFIERSIEISASIKQRERFCLVIGNPPYRNNSAWTLAYVSSKFPTLLKSSVQIAKAQERNIRDDYAWFFAAADHYLQGTGLICFITSDSYARKRSYRLFRRELLRNYTVVAAVRLGHHIFQDVGPRMSFLIVLLEKRVAPLEDLQSLEPFPYINLAELAANTPASELGTSADPRLIALNNVVMSKRMLTGWTSQTPSEAHEFGLLPIDEGLVERVFQNSVPVYAKGVDRLFVRKWPGLITAFDVLLKADTHVELRTKVEEFFALSTRYKADSRLLERHLTAWAEENKFSQAELQRLIQLANSVNRKGLTFTANNIKRSVSGTMPNEVRWYPPNIFRHYIYYDVGIEIPRNTHEGKAKGWGWMQQWREPESHTIIPKLIFTTSTNPKAGYKAFVVDDEWYVKHHGGTSQVYNYTGLIDPTVSQRLGGEANNLTAAGADLSSIFTNQGLPADQIFHYIAAIYNSSLAMEFLNQESGHELRVKIPTQNQIELVSQVSELARDLRDIHRLLFDLPSGTAVSTVIEALASRRILSSLGLKATTSSSRGYRDETFYDLPNDLPTKIKEAIAVNQDKVDAIVEDLYS
jgi:hypothetical protein